MSRSYNVNIEVKNKFATIHQVKKIMVDELGWDGEPDEYDGLITFSGEGRLCGGQSEEEAHKQIVNEFKRINKKAKVLTRWTYMEELPYNEYGDVD